MRGRRRGRSSYRHAGRRTYSRRPSRRARVSRGRQRIGYRL